LVKGNEQKANSNNQTSGHRPRKKNRNKTFSKYVAYNILEYREEPGSICLIT
jgi:hypothetical protein